jgi:DNA-binding NtrC family response regulator
MNLTENDWSVLLVDDEPQILLSSSLILRNAGFRKVETLNDSRLVPSFLSRHTVAVIVLDLFMPHLSGQELLALLSRRYTHIPTIVMTAADKLETAVECMKAGAFDYLVKPVEKNRLLSSVTAAMEIQNLREQVSSLKQQFLDDRLENPSAFSRIATASKKMRAIFQYCEVIARSTQPILVCGETGTGKELIARAIHDVSECPGRFVALNSAGLDDHVFSDTLFGHKRGAFTGADQERNGLVATAAGGTLFLDEIGDLQESSQIKLLRLLQEQEYYPVGSDLPKKCSARIVAATNRNLKEMVAAGTFRNDLYFRLCAHQVLIPPLRERREDIPLLLELFLRKSSTVLKKKTPKPPTELATLLSTYDFPGNVRELETMVIDAVARHVSGVLSMKSFQAVMAQASLAYRPEREAFSLETDALLAVFGGFPSLKQAEEILIEEALNRSGNNQGIAASLLGITRQALNKRLKRSM